jgi:hypothetical protein
MGWIFAAVLLHAILTFYFWSTTMATLAELQTEVVGLTTQMERNNQEVLDKIAELEGATGDMTTTPEFDAKFAALKAAVQKADDDVKPGTAALLAATQRTTATPAPATGTPAAPRPDGFVEPVNRPHRT